MQAEAVHAFSRGWAARLRTDPLARCVLETFWDGRERYVAELVGITRRNEFAADAPDDRGRQILDHCRAVAWLGQGRAGELGRDPLGFVVRHGIRRARQPVPLQSVLRGYRDGHKSFWTLLCRLIDRAGQPAEVRMRTMELLSQYCIEYTDLISLAVTDAYLEEETALAAERTRVRAALMDGLLRGELPRSAQEQALWESAGLAGGRPLAVAVGRRGPADRAALAPGELAALARLIETTLPRSGFDRLVDVRADEVVAIIGGPPDPGLRAAEALRAALKPAAGDQVVIGVGLEVAEPCDLPRSLGEARLAIEITDGRRPVVPLSEVSLDAYLRHRADDTARRLTPPWTEALKAGKLIPTLEAFAAASLNVKGCARRLNVHNNTVYHRLNRIRGVTGIDPRTYAGLSQLIAALSVAGVKLSADA